MIAQVAARSLATGLHHFPVDPEHYPGTSLPRSSHPQNLPSCLPRRPSARPLGYRLRAQNSHGSLQTRPALFPPGHSDEAARSTPKEWVETKTDQEVHVQRRKTARGVIEEKTAVSKDNRPLGPSTKRLHLDCSAPPLLEQLSSKSTHPDTAAYSRMETITSGRPFEQSLIRGGGQVPETMQQSHPTYQFGSHLSTDTSDHVPYQQPQSFRCMSVSSPHRSNPFYALQPADNPIAIPSAPDQHGPYGPYWPDGKYVPYRPASHQFPPQSASFQRLAAASSGYQYPRPPYGSSPDTSDPLAPIPGAAFVPELNSTSQPSYSGPGQWPHEGPYGSMNSHFSTVSQHHHTLSSNRHGWDNRLLNSGKFSTNLSYGSQNNLDYSLQHQVQSYLRTLPDSASQAHFRDRALARAHQIYALLLTSLNGTKQTLASQPRQNISISSTPSRGTSNDPAASYQAIVQHGHTSNLQTIDPRTGQTFDAVGSTSYPQVDAVLHDTAIIASEQLPERKFNRLTRHQPSALAESDLHPTSNAQALGTTSGNVLCNPAIGIEIRKQLLTLETLCATSRNPWFDGLLLAGCLAYGLGEFVQASTLFHQILQNNPDHVEALSNLAATSLALGQRAIAEQQWFKAIRLRPSYFEAVEHLIGLLCSTGRTQAVVDLIDRIEKALKLPSGPRYINADGDEDRDAVDDQQVDGGSIRSMSVSTAATSDNPFQHRKRSYGSISSPQGSGATLYAITPSDTGRFVALLHARANLLYAAGAQVAAAKSFELVILTACGSHFSSIEVIINTLLRSLALSFGLADDALLAHGSKPLLLPPDRALETARLLFGGNPVPPGLRCVAPGLPLRAAVSTVSNSLLSLAKIYQDGICSASGSVDRSDNNISLRDILLLYYLSLALQPSPSTANNVGILLAGVQQNMPADIIRRAGAYIDTKISGVQVGSGIALALAFYQYGLGLDRNHAHLYTNFGSLLKDIGHLQHAIGMYEAAVRADPNFDIALANLANAVKDQGRVAEAIKYYHRAVAVNPDFAEAVCGLANALNSVCSWNGRGGEVRTDWDHDQWHVGPQGQLFHVCQGEPSTKLGWMKRVIDIVTQQLKQGAAWGKDTLTRAESQALVRCIKMSEGFALEAPLSRDIADKIRSWIGKDWEGSRITRLVQRLTRRLCWRWYQDQYVQGRRVHYQQYLRPLLPAALTIPNAPTVLPFHTFTCPLGAKVIRQISQRNALRLACTTLKLSWLPPTVYPPPSPPQPALKVGYVSSDFNNHPLAHLMQSVFGMHNRSRVIAYCYATSTSDNSVHRQQIERESPYFRDVSAMSNESTVAQILRDGIHILINLNGYTRGARNEVFAARAAPIQMAFMGFAGSLGAEWCDYLLADKTAVPPTTLRPHRSNVTAQDIVQDDTEDDKDDTWMYSENVIFTKRSFFCCDHKQSAPDAQQPDRSWQVTQQRYWLRRKELFPNLPDDMIILANFNQLYKFDPTTFRTWLRILQTLPNAVLWLLRFPELGEANLRETALRWATPDVANRIIFTDVSDKARHLDRCGIADLVLDTGECNAHTTAADVLWSGTPMVTRLRYDFKMCSRIGGSIVRGALPLDTADGRRAEAELVVNSEEEYEQRVVELGSGLVRGSDGSATGRLVDLKRMLYEARGRSSLFDTKGWVNELERAYAIAWSKWVKGEGGDIWL